MSLEERPGMGEGGWLVDWEGLSDLSTNYPDFLIAIKGAYGSPICKRRERLCLEVQPIVSRFGEAAFRCVEVQPISGVANYAKGYRGNFAMALARVLSVTLVPPSHRS